jgi:hypothetical protein
VEGDLGNWGDFIPHYKSPFIALPTRTIFRIYEVFPDPAGSRAKRAMVKRGKASSFVLVAGAVQLRIFCSLTPTHERGNAICSVQTGILLYSGTRNFKRLGGDWLARS